MGVNERQCWHNSAYLAELSLVGVCGTLLLLLLLPDDDEALLIFNVKLVFADV